MTADNNNDTTGQTQEQGSARRSRGRKASRKRTGARGAADKRGRTAASRRSSSGSGSRPEQAGSSSARGRGRPSSSRSGAGSSASGRTSVGIGARLLAGASRAIPLASRGFGEQRIVQRLVDERPYMLGAIGLGIGAMIGLMLPGTLSSMRGRSGRGRSNR